MTIMAWNSKTGYKTGYELKRGIVMSSYEPPFGYVFLFNVYG